MVIYFPFLFKLIFPERVERCGTSLILWRFISIIAEQEDKVINLVRGHFYDKGTIFHH